jgi:Putative prokaryotic signal transducing protein
MDELKYELLTEVNGRMQADLLKSYLEAEGIKVELFQEAIGHHIYPVMIDGLARVQIFVPKAQAAEAHKLLDEYDQTTSTSEDEK